MAFNFLHQHNHLHNFDFAIYYKLQCDKMSNNIIGKIINEKHSVINGASNLQKQNSVSSWNISLP